MRGIRSGRRHTSRSALPWRKSAADSSTTTSRRRSSPAPRARNLDQHPPVTAGRMLTFLLFVLPMVFIGGIIWLVTFPLRLLFGFVFGGLFRLVFGVLGALLGLLLAPLILIVLAVGLVGAVIVGLFALLTPLIPVILLALLGWG